jgi:hypothetical protein
MKYKLSGDTAAKLKEAGYPQPEKASPGQLWYIKRFKGGTMEQWEPNFLNFSTDIRYSNEHCYAPDAFELMEAIQSMDNDLSASVDFVGSDVGIGKVFNGYVTLFPEAAAILLSQSRAKPKKVFSRAGPNPAELFAAIWLEMSLPLPDSIAVPAE